MPGSTCPPPAAVPKQPATEFILQAGTLEDHTAVIQHAIDTCSAQGGGKVILRCGAYSAGTVILRDHTTLHLEKGAVLSGSRDITAYLRRSGRPGARLNGGENTTALIYADKARNIALTGEGTLNGNGTAFFTKSETIPAWIESKKRSGTWIPGFETSLSVPERPKALILFAECSGVAIELAHVENSPAWSIHLLACNNVRLRSIALRGALDGCNTDGIDLDSCSDVLIEDCDILTGDDAIALKSTGLWGLKRPSRGITVRRCRLRSTTHGFTIGTETQESFESIILKDSRIECANNYRTLTGIGLSMIDGASLSGVRISNVIISDVIAPIQVRLANAGRGQKTPEPGSIQDLTFDHVEIRGAAGNCLLAGLPGHPLREICMRNVSLDFAGEVDFSRVMTEVPILDQEFPPSEIWRFLPAYGMFCRDIDGLEYSNVEIRTAMNEKRPAVKMENVRPFASPAAAL